MAKKRLFPFFEANRFFASLEVMGSSPEIKFAKLMGLYNDETSLGAGANILVYRVFTK
jgi:hypothetical protein